MSFGIADKDKIVSTSNNNKSPRIKDKKRIPELKVT